MGGGSKTSPIDDLRMSLEMAAASQPDDTTRARNRATTANDLWSVTPVVGNAMSARDALEAYKEAREAAKVGDVKGTAKAGGMMALNTIGAVSGLPFGRGAGIAAKGGKDRLNVFVPVEEGKLSARARDMRDAGKTNPEVHDATGMLFGPDGTLRRWIPDNRMDIDMSFNPGDITTVGNLVNHPTLFREMPDLQNRIVHVTDKVDSYSASVGKPRGISRTDPITGNFEWSKAGMEPYGDMAKLIQYDINDRVGFSPAGRHRFDDQLADIQKAQMDALRADAPIDAKAAYAQAMEAIKGDMQDGLRRRMKFKDLSRGMTDRTAGSVDSKIVRGRANELPSTPHYYPYQKAAPWLKGPYKLPDFQDMMVMPPANMTPEDWTQFLTDWRRFGAGKGA